MALYFAWWFSLRLKIAQIHKRFHVELDLGTNIRLSVTLEQIYDETKRVTAKLPVQYCCSVVYILPSPTLHIATLPRITLPPHVELYYIITDIIYVARYLVVVILLRT